MQWRAEAVDAVLSFSAGIAGVGASFTLLPAGGLRRENTIILDICRSGPGGQQCCTNKDGIKLGPAGRGVSFDVNADGYPDFVQWVRPGGDEAFLALDHNRNGIVDDGSDLFGVGTPLFEGGKAPNGFVGLAQYDQSQLGGNDDGVISSADAIWPELSMWLDSNADGISTANEMRRPEALGFRSFGTIPKVRRLKDEAGNTLPYWAWATTASAPRRTIMVDVYFLILSPTDLISQPDAKCPGTKPLPHVS